MKVMLVNPDMDHEEHMQTDLDLYRKSILQDAKQIEVSPTDNRSAIEKLDDLTPQQWQDRLLDVVKDPEAFKQLDQTRQAEIITDASLFGFLDHSDRVKAALFFPAGVATMINELNKVWLTPEEIKERIAGYYAVAWFRFLSEFITWRLDHKGENPDEEMGHILGRILSWSNDVIAQAKIKMEEEEKQKKIKAERAKKLHAARVLLEIVNDPEAFLKEVSADTDKLAGRKPTTRKWMEWTRRFFAPKVT